MTWPQLTSTDDRVSPIFPNQIISEILTRLPSKDLCRFKSVSKNCNSLITHPHFLTTYISLHSPTPTWVPLDRLIRFPATSPTHFPLINPSHVHTLSINPHLLLNSNESLSDPFSTPFITLVVGSSGGLLLFSVSVTTAQRKAQPQDVLFVVNPVTGELARLPPPPHKVFHPHMYGFITRVGPSDGVGEFVVGVFEPDPFSPKSGNLMCFSSQTGKWAQRKASYKYNPSSRSSLRRGMLYLYFSFEFEGKLVWTDVSVGMVIWTDDPFTNNVVHDVEFKFVPIPEGRAREECTPDMMMRRSIGPGGGFIQYVEMFEDRRVKVWRLKSEERWELVYNVRRGEIERSLGCGIGSDPGVWFMDPFDGDKVVFGSKDMTFTFNFATRVVESRTIFSGHTAPFPFVIPSWPTSLPPSFHAANAKEQGNECFKRQKYYEAIICYSTSIASSPNSAAYANRAMAYLKIGGFREAEADCTEALNLDAGYFKVYVRRAIARKELGNLEGAMDDVNIALDLDPDNKEVKEQYAEIKCLLEKESCEE